MAGIDWGSLLAGGEGAANELLFGAPEWLIRKLGGGKQLDEKIARYKKAHDIGSTAGLIGSALVPYGAIAKGAGLVGKGIKGAEEAGKALTLAKEAGEAASLVKPAKSILEMAGKSAALGAGEQAARGFFKDETPEEIARDASSGMLFGGLGGAAGGALSKFGPKLAKIAKKEINKATLGMVPGLTRRDILPTIQKLSGEGSGPFAQTRNVEDIIDELATTARKGKIHREGVAEEFAEKHKKIWNMLDDAYKSVAGNKKGQEILTGSISGPEMAKLISDHGQAAVDAASAKLSSTIGDVSGFANIRSKLESMAKLARSGNLEDQGMADAMYDMSKLIRSNFDDAVVKVAEQSGVKIPENFKREYGLLMPFMKATVKAEAAPRKFNLGSPTMEKLAIGGAFGTLGGASGGENIKERLERAAIGGIGGFAASKALSSLLRRGLSAAHPLAEAAEKIAPKIAEAPEALAGVAGREAANVARAAAATNPETEGEVEAAQEGAGLGQAPREEYNSQVLAKLTEYARTNGVEPGTQDFKEFIQYVGTSTIGDDGQPFDAAALSHIFYPDPDERKKFLRALEVSRGLASNLPTALKSVGGIAGIGANKEIGMERDVALDKLAKMIGEAAEASGGTAANAKNMLKTVINSRASQADKRRMIEGMMTNYGVDFSTLGRVGLNV